ncbi:hypothetical protein [Cryptosporangium arvum]|uniref:Uncharacterized protein n=1 Tax=Cryptosporangium arvum DSM 44712 TaxID=927661 RepID=A0A010ZUM1_9ACTN|nr:hypothetical protein [Cryptosporangium arvum]EXG82384.1 hypothetical protein CryarDRAFT_3562 [Cryptosporangium arvum DSM 44712]
MTSRTIRSRWAAAAAIAVVAAATGGAAISAPAAAAGTPTTAASAPPPGQRSLTIASSPEKFDWRKATLDVPWTTPRLPDGSRCPGGRLSFQRQTPAESDFGKVQLGRHSIYVRKVDTADVTRDGQPDQLIQFNCLTTKTTVGYTWYYVYSFKKVYGYHGKINYRPYVRDYVTSTEFKANAKWVVQGIDARSGAVDVRQSVKGARSNPIRRVFRWSDRRGLIASRPLPVHPEADRAPR